MGRNSQLRDVLYGCGVGRRFTQDSPVLPDVWIEYDGPENGRTGAKAYKPFEHQKDLLLTPHFGGLSGRAAKDLRTALVASREIRGREPPSVAQLPGVVAARIYLDELLRIVLPRTRWWKDMIEQAQAEKVFENSPEAILKKIEEMRTESKKGIVYTGKGIKIPVDFAWLVQVVAFLIWNGQTQSAGESSPEESRAPEPRPEDMREAYEALFGEKTEFPPLDETSDPMIGLVAINRRATTAVMESTGPIMESALAVKADAARLLFNVSCKYITWAVIDSGIDGSHPAFAKWETVEDAAANAEIAKNVKNEETTEDAEREARKNSRIKGTYDLTLVRQLLDPSRISGLFKDGAVLEPPEQKLAERYRNNLERRGLDAEDAPKLARELSDRLKKGFELDWGLVEPFLWDEDPKPPPRPHGTMVAGILAADWRKEPKDNSADPGANPGLETKNLTPWTVYMQGMCPDIRLYDFRVIGDEGDAGEFEVLAALQLIRHLNNQSDRRLIHGANLSLSTEHDVTSYACGSTLICQECDRTWASGVVLVAAAGNRGHQHYMVSGPRPELGGYHAMSITDPGNAEGVITVGATHRAQPHQYGVSYFSSRGPTGDGRRKPDLVAPGEKVTGPVPYRAQKTDDGTSFAAPHVSGASAMLMARHAELIGRPQRIKEILCATATDLGRERYFQGSGMLDILRALQSV